jgi:APA family basic amino acid/polyamine antiporter
MQIFRRKPIADLVPEGSEGEGQMKRTLGAWDLVFLAIGAVIGAGIFGAIGTAAAGEMRDGEMVRAGAGPGLVMSFVLLGLVCGLAALCYAELASMIPQAGSAYAYTYATLGELVAWIIGWDLILEYAVGNVAVAISWGNYFCTLTEAAGLGLPAWLSHGYGDVVQQAGAGNADMQALLETAPHVAGVPVLVNLPAFLVVVAITWLLLLGAKESARANNVMVIIKLLVLALFVIVGATRIDSGHYTPFFPNGFTGVWQGAAIVFFAYIGFDAISTAAEETKNPQRNMPIGILGGLAICTIVYVAVGLVVTGLAPWQELNQHGDPLAFALENAGLPVAGWIVSAGAVVSMSAVLLVFQYGQPRILFAMARDGLLPERAAKLHPKYRTPWALTIGTGVVVALGSLVVDDDATYDLTNIGTLFAFFLVCIGVMVLRVVDPDRPRPFRVPFVWVVAPLGAAACVFTMAGLPAMAWERFGVWLVLGLVVYFAYGFWRSKLRTPA